MSTARRTFIGADGPRSIRALSELMRRDLSREQLDGVAGVSNGPDLIAGLRRRGLELPCRLVTVKDRDGRNVRAGIYSLTDRDRSMFLRWLSKRIKGNVA